MQARSKSSPRRERRTAAVRLKGDAYYRYMDAAEKLFIKFGYEGTSIRGIAEEAGAHLGTLHHYWGSKEELFRETCKRRFDPVQTEQLIRLRECERRMDAGERVPLSDIVRCLVEPPVMAGATSHSQQNTIRLLYGRALTEPSPVVMSIVRDVLNDATQVFVPLVRRACTELDPPTFYWRFTCAMGAFIFTQSFGDRVAFMFDKPVDPVDWRFVVDEIVAFVARGMAAEPKPSHLAARTQPTRKMRVSRGKR